MLALAPIMFLIGRVWKLPGYKALVSAAAFVSTAAFVIPVRGILLSQSDFNKPMNLLSHRVIQDFVNKIDTMGYRVDFRDTVFDNKFWAMNASYYGIKSFYNQLTPQPYPQFQFILLRSVPHLREMMGARYVLCGAAESPTAADAKQMLETEGYKLYENANPMSRLTLVHQVAGSATNVAGFLEVVQRGFDYLAEAYVTPHDLERVRQFFGNRPMLARPEDVVANVINQPNRSYSRVQSNAGSLLILNEWFTSAWKVRVNGINQPTLRVNQWQVGVLLPAGKNDVEFEYRPMLFRTLMSLNRTTVVLVLGFLIFLWYRNRRTTSSDPV
jgi:hypothetical protein